MFGWSIDGGLGSRVYAPVNSTSFPTHGERRIASRRSLHRLDQRISMRKRSLGVRDVPIASPPLRAFNLRPR
jgi:hypothetical protein